MRKYEIIIEVDTDVIAAVYQENDGDKNDPVEDMITSEFSWLNQSGIYLDKIVKEIV